MATITAEQYKLLIVDEVNDADTGVVADNIDLYWEMFADQADLFRRYLYTKRQAIQLLLGAERKQTTRQIQGGGVELDDNALTRHLTNLHAITQAQIDEAERGGTAASSGWGRTPERA